MLHLLKMLFLAYNFFIFIHMFQRISSKFFFDFRFSRRKSQSQQKLSIKITYFAIQVLSKHLTHFTNHNSLGIENNMLPKHCQKSFSLYKLFSKHISFWCQKKHLHCTISWHPSTAFVKHFESKCLHISVYFCISNKKNFCFKEVIRFYLVAWGMVGVGMIFLGMLAVWVSWICFLIFHFNWIFLEIQLFSSISILP